ncbi:MAG: 30S ribosomal protein S6 [Pseudomonadota bacterium]|nr:30S ribosomal protein S6 [Pseudomonadota bacterium]
MTRRYETIFITPADIPDEELQAAIERYAAIITGRKGLLIKVEKWGKRKLAYEIKKQFRGFYVLLDFAGQTDIVSELERNFKIDDKILKYMTVKKDDAVDLKALEGESSATPEGKAPEDDIPAAAADTEGAADDATATAAMPPSSGE